MHWLHQLSDWAKVCEDCAGQAGLSFLAIVGVARWIGLDSLAFFTEWREEKYKIRMEEKKRESDAKELSQ